MLPFVNCFRSYGLLVRHFHISRTLPRLLSNSISQPNLNNESTKSQNEEIFEKRHSTNDEYFVEPTEIKSLNIRERIETFEKHGSVFQNLFLGTIDKDLLNFPFLLRSRQEFLDLNKQYEMVRKTWNKIKKDDETLNILKYNSLYKMSVSEMMYIFEAIGASVQKNLPFGTKESEENRFEKKLLKTFKIESNKDPFTINEAGMLSFHNVREIIQTIVPLIERNAIAYYAISRSSNDNVRDILDKEPKIAFAYDEDFPDRIDISINQWASEAKLSFDFNSWVIIGGKNRIIDQDYSHYLIFSKANRFPASQPKTKLDNDVGIVGLLVPAEKIKIESDYVDYFAIPHQRISFDHIELYRNQWEVTNATKDISEYSNIKGCGQLAVSAVILGLLKQLQKNTYGHIVNNCIGLTNCELVQYKLFQSTCKIYALESMVYLTAAMFDSFEKGIHLGNESIVAKTMATQFAYDIISDLRSLYGSRYPFSSTVYDLIYYLDSYLDSSLNNRMFMAKEAVKHFKTFEEATLSRLNFIERGPIFHIKSYLKHRKLRRYECFLTREITKYIHHNMHSACDWIEHCLTLLQFSIYYFDFIYKDKIHEKHMDLDRSVEMAMDIHMMIACISRANHSLCYGFRNNHTEKEICLAICKDTFLKHLRLFESVDKRVMADNDQFARNIFETNLQERGYFPKLFQFN